MPFSCWVCYAFAVSSTAIAYIWNYKQPVVLLPSKPIPNSPIVVLTCPTVSSVLSESSVAMLIWLSALFLWQF